MSTPTPKPVRASSLPGALNCPASVRECEGLPNVSSDPSRLGSMAHAIAERFAKGEEPDDAELSRIADSFGCSAEDGAEWAGRMSFVKDVARLVGNGWTAYSEMTLGLDISLLYGPHDYSEGHPDLVLVSPDFKTILIYDWKTGRLEVPPPEINPQMWHYAVAAYDHFYLASKGKRVAAESITATIFYPRTREAKSATWDTAGIELLNRKLMHLFSGVTAERPEYRPGVHCALCSARLKCAALHRELSPILIDYSAEPVPFSGLSVIAQGSLVAKAKIAEKIAADVLEAAKLHVIETGRGIDLGDGREFNFKTTAGNREVDPVKAWPVLDQQLGVNMVKCISVSLSDAEEEAKEQTRKAHNGKPPRGAIGQAAKGLTDALNDAGAISRKPDKKVFSIRAIAPAIESTTEEP